MSRVDDVVAATRAMDALIGSKGVSLNAEFNGRLRYSTPSVRCILRECSPRSPPVPSTVGLLVRLGQSPETYERLKAEPTLATNATYEAVRLDTPLRGFSGSVNEDFALSTSTPPAGSRAWLVYAAANLDERHYDDPGRFDLDRASRDHVRWGVQGYEQLPIRRVPAR
ncbi:MAG: hypothetical protein AB8G26_02735 [Ilumatobacter sp.]